MNKLHGYVAWLDGRPILSSIRGTADMCRQHLEQDLGVDTKTLIQRGYQCSRINLEFPSFTDEWERMFPEYQERH